MNFIPVKTKLLSNNAGIRFRPKNLLSPYFCISLGNDLFKYNDMKGVVLGFVISNWCNEYTAVKSDVYKHTCKLKDIL